MSQNWSIISGASANIAVSEIQDPQGIIVPGTIYGFNGAYYPADSITQGNGYWIKTSAAGNITISDTNAANVTLARQLAALPDLEQFPSLTFSDANNRSQRLHFNVLLDKPKQIESFSLPPLPPPGGFDARFEGDYRILNGDEGLIYIQASNYPVTIRGTNLPIDQGYGVEEILSNGDAGETHRIQTGKDARISNPDVRKLRLFKTEAIPLTFEVSQNYPNPFNPVTQIRYALPADEKVEITIYNMLGQKIKTLVAGHKPAGRYTVTWNATNDAGNQVGSGVFFYRVKAGEHQALKKMLLLK
ncbi:MAG: FlgD immunoglobulin-like domain containing protein [Calditrichia bacterium]